MSTKHADAKPAHETKNTAEQIAPDQMQEQPTGIFGLPTFAQSQPRNVLQLQRMVGNARTQRILGQQIQRSPRHIQRDIAGGKVGGGISSTGVKVNWERTHSFPERSYGYATFKVEAGVGMEAELSWSEDSMSVGAESKNADENALKAKVGIWEDKAVEAEKADVWKAVWDDHFNVQNAALEFEGKNTNEAKDSNTTTMGVALVITTAAGDEHKLFLNLFESRVNSTESTILGPHGGAEINIAIIPPMLRSAALSQGLKLTGMLKGKATLTVRPNWVAIAAQAAQRYGPAFLAQAFRTAATGGGWLTMGLIAGGVETIRGYYQFIQEMAELKQLRRESDAAVPGYVAGFMAGLGVTSYSGGDAGWGTYGMGRGQVAYAAGLQEMKKRLAVMAQTYGVDASTISDEELDEMLKSVIQQKAESIHSSIHGAVNYPIRMLYFNKYKETHDLDTKGQEMHARAYAGLPVSGALPDPFQKTEVPLESGAVGDAPPDDNSQAATFMKKNKDAPKQTYTPSPAKAPASAQEAAKNDPTPTPYANNASGRNDDEQADAEEADRQQREAHQSEHWSVVDNENMEE